MSTCGEKSGVDREGMLVYVCACMCVFMYVQ